MKKTILLSLMLLILKFSNVNAAIITTDWNNVGDSFITRDTTSGLNWLDLTVTGGMSYNDVFAELMLESSELYGYRFATSDEVISLWEQFGINLDFGVRNIVTPTTPGVEIASSFLGNVVGAESPDYTGSIGMIFTDWRSHSVNSAGAFNFEGSSFLEGIGIRGSSFDTGVNFMGSYLVSPSPVPLPASIWLIFSGLIALFSFTRNKHP